MFCQNCGNQFPDNFNACPKCGAPVAANQQPQAQAPVYQAPQYQQSAPQTQQTNAYNYQGPYNSAPKKSIRMDFDFKNIGRNMTILDIVSIAVTVLLFIVTLVPAYKSAFVSDSYNIIYVLFNDAAFCGILYIFTSILSIIGSLIKNDIVKIASAGVMFLSFIPNFIKVSDARRINENASSTIFGKMEVINITGAVGFSIVLVLALIVVAILGIVLKNVPTIDGGSKKAPAYNVQPMGVNSNAYPNQNANSNLYQNTNANQNVNNFSNYDQFNNQNNR